jgi:hypothetical protein
VPRFINDPARIYADTSVFGGCFDAEFQLHSQRFFDLARRGMVVVLLSDLVRSELETTPALVRELFDGLPGQFVESIPLSDDVLWLRDAYLAAGIVSRRSREDALHVAAATVGRADAIVSWNFKHIVSLARIRGYNQVNFQRGYGVLTILSPEGVLRDDDE